MAEIKISELTANGANLQATDRIPTAVDDGLGGFVTRYVTGDEVIGAVSKTTVPVRNQSGATIYKGTIVYISSAAGNKLLISKSRANSEATSARTLGVVTANIPNNSNGNVQTSGILTNLDTRSSATHPFTSVTLAEGDTLYLDPTTAGYITNVKPSAPNHLVYIGKVINASPTTGEILYQVQNGYELDEIHDVAIASVADNDVLQYDSATSLWKNRAISSGLTVGTTAITSGTIGGILFQNGSNLLGQDAALFWDNTNKRLGVGATPSTSVRLDVRAQGALSSDLAFRVRNSANTGNIFQINGDGSVVTNAINLGNTPASNFTAPFLSITNGGSTSLSFATMSNNLYNFNIDRYCNLATNGAGANTNGAGALLLGAGGTPSTRNYQLTVAGLNAISQGTNDSGFAQTGADTSSNNAMYVNYIGKNWTIGGTLQGNGKRVFSIITGTEPTTNVLDGFQQYSADIVAGNAAPHFRTENGNIIKLYQQPTGGAASTFVTNTSLIANDTATFDGYTIGQVVKALRNTGILA